MLRVPRQSALPVAQRFSAAKTPRRAKALRHVGADSAGTQLHNAVISSVAARQRCEEAPRRAEALRHIGTDAGGTQLHDAVTSSGAALQRCEDPECSLADAPVCTGCV